MSGSLPDKSTPEDASAKRKSWILWGLTLLGFIFLTEGVLRGINHGGIFALMSAIIAALAKSPVIDVDENGLRFLIVSITGFAGLLICARLNIDMDKRLNQGLVIMALLGSGFLLDGLYGGRLIGYVMVAQGYTRCASRDHIEGHGKFEVQLNDYLLVRGNCPVSASETDRH